MINWNEYNRLFENLFYMKDQDYLKQNFTKKIFRSSDGNYSFTYMVKENDTKHDELNDLQYKLKICVEKQDFETAVELRDKLLKLEKNKEEICELEKKLHETIKNQEFEKSIEYRDLLKKLK